MEPQWIEMPRGSKRLTHGEWVFDVWQMGGGIWRWTVMRGGIYLDTGDCDTETDARNDALQSAISSDLFHPVSA
jgi:hypothetical protein